MKFKLLLFILACCWLQPASADSQTTFSYSYVTITNNTKHTIDIKSSLSTTDAAFTRGRDWEADTSTLNPYETKQLLWFSRNKNVKSGVSYQFNIIASRADYSGQNLQISLQEQGKSVFGSTITESLTFPAKSPNEILNKTDFDVITDQCWDSSCSIYAKSQRPLGSAFSNFQFVIDEPEIIAFDTSSTQTFSVLTYNTQMMPFYAGAVDDLNQPGIRANDIPAKIKQFDAVVLEELFDKKLRQTIISKMSAYYPYHTLVVGNATSRPLTGGVVIFSKWPIVKEDQIVFSACSGVDCLAAKGAAYTALLKNGKLYHLIGTHLQAENHQGDIQTRTRQLSEMVNFIDRLNIPTDQPLLIGGDFNIDEFSEEFQTLTGILQSGLPENIGHPYSYDGAINTMTITRDRNRLDYVFFSKNHTQPSIALNKVYLLRDHDNKSMWPKFDLSDHFPTAAYFRY